MLHRYEKEVRAATRMDGYSHHGPEGCPATRLCSSRRLRHHSVSSYRKVKFIFRSLLTTILTIQARDKNDKGLPYVGLNADWIDRMSGINITCQRMMRTPADASALSFFASAACRSFRWCVVSSSSITATMLEPLLQTTKSTLIRLIRLCHDRKS